MPKRKRWIVIACPITPKTKFAAYNVAAQLISPTKLSKIEAQKICDERNRNLDAKNLRCNRKLSLVS